MGASVFDNVEEMNSDFLSYGEAGMLDEGERADDIGCSLSHHEDGIYEPYVGMEFNSEQSAKVFYDGYARKLGFSTKNGDCTFSKTDGAVISRAFVCSADSINGNCAESCKALLSIERKEQDKWCVVNYVRDHNHSLAKPDKVSHIRSRRHVVVSVAKNNSKLDSSPFFSPSSFMHISDDRNRGQPEGVRSSKIPSLRMHMPSSKNCTSASYFADPISQKRSLGRDAQNLLEYFKNMQAENPGFFYAIQLDSDNQLQTVFWADARSRTAFCHFSDTLTLDTSYRVNQCKVPFASFQGVNHHGHTILFGCAILLDESETSFMWLFRTFLTAMHGQQPASITTDQDRAIQAAVSLVFPEIRHCINKWHMLREGQEKLAHVCFKHPNFQMELYNCINLTETIEEFESCWSSVIDKYNLRGHTWLESLFDSRSQWVPVYFRNSFFGVVSSNQGYGSSFFDGFINQKTTLPMLLRQYERALESWFEKEQDADLDTICAAPLLKTPSPMEKQAAHVYTKRIFCKFQEELVETFVYTANQIDEGGAESVFKVAKFEEDRKAYLVTFNFMDMKASCSCQMFEYSGILCRHILTVFTVTNILTLPTRYILKRWTMNAKDGTRIEERVGQSNGLENFTMRYNSLCREGIRFAEEGSVNVETYNAALGALKESGKKVAVVKKKASKATSSNMQATTFGCNERKVVSLSSETTPLLWPLQDEVIRRSNFNDGGNLTQSVADLNIPYMAPISLQQDDNPGNMVGLPSLKSMTWVMENKISSDGHRIAIISLKLQDNNKIPLHETEVKFKLSKLTLEPMLRSMANISDQLWTTANRVAVINMKLQETDSTSGDSEVKFQVSGDTLSAMLRSMVYIREQLTTADPHLETCSKKQRM